MKLWHKVVIGLFSGIVFGYFSSEMGQSINWVAGRFFGYNFSVSGKDIVEAVHPIGEIFINMIKMVVVPLIFFSLISGITSMTDSRSLGRIGIKACAAFVATTAFAIVIGLVSASVIHPGEGVNLPHSAGFDATKHVTENPSILKILLDIVPINAIGAMAEGHILQVVFFAIFTGITLNAMGPEGKKLIEFSQMMAKMVFKMIGLIIKLSPYGVFALIAWVVGTQGLDILRSLIKLIGVVVLACSLQYLIFGMFIIIFGRISPLQFYKKSLEYQALAFATSSSKATLATTMKVCQDKLGISKSSTSFVLPLGASINMDGTAIYLGICAIFFAQATGTHLLPHDYFMIVLTATLGSIGAAGIPGGSLIMMSMVLSAVNLPLEGIGLIAGIDRILDMLRTTINITGDATITLIIDKTEGTLNESVYYAKKEALNESL